jgi:hypothetical protein
MATFEITLKRTSFSRVTVEADSMAAAKKQIADDGEKTWELFATSNEVWHDGEIKVSSIKRADDK